MSDHAKFSSYKEYLRETRMGQGVIVKHKFPMQTKQGGLDFPGINGTLTAVYDDVFGLRTEDGDVFIAWDDAFYFFFPSDIKLVKNAGQISH